MSVFISKWDIRDNHKTLTLPLIPSGTYDFDVDWGDGSTEHIKSHQANHQYSKPGTYEVRITGTINGWCTFLTLYTRIQLLDICQWGCLKLGNAGRYFEGCKNLQITATDAPDLSETTKLYSMFGHCESFNSPIGHWDVSHITDMSRMFCGAVSFNQPLNSWNVSNVTNMSGMFSEEFNNLITAFNQPLSDWNVSNVTNMANMFNGSSFNQPIGSWNVSRVADMRMMFSDTTCFNQPLNSWNVSNVTIMRYMFLRASAFNQDISQWNIMNVENMLGMIEDATAFDTENRNRLSLWSVQNPHILEQILGRDKVFRISNRKVLIDWSEFNSDSFNDYNCAICMTDILNKDDWRAFMCHSTMKQNIPHCFHKDCIESWIAMNTTCPSCRGKVIPRIGTSDTPNRDIGYPE